METIVLDFRIPTGWEALSDRQLRMVFSMLAGQFSSEEIKLLCLLRWNNVNVAARDGDCVLLKSRRSIFRVGVLALADILHALDWMDSFPDVPVRLSRIGWRKALPGDFEEVPFGSFIMADNLYQGYLATRDEALLDDMAEVLYGGRVSLGPAERVSVFYWFASLKGFFARRFSDFYQLAGDDGGNLLGASPASVEDAMNAQIRALTKGDISKEKEILSLDTWRALAELNAQAREYKYINSKYGKNS